MEEKDNGLKDAVRLAHKELEGVDRAIEIAMKKKEPTYYGELIRIGETIRIKRPDDKKLVHPVAECNRLLDENRELRKYLEEAVDLMEDIITGNYTPDSFTTQPWKEVLR